MTIDYSRLRHRGTSGDLMVTDAVEISFYIRHSRHEIGGSLVRSLDAFRQVAEADRLNIYYDSEDAPEYSRKLSRQAWQAIYQRLSDPEPHPGYGLELCEQHEPLDGLSVRCQSSCLKWYATMNNVPEQVSWMHFRLPTAYLEEHGPEGVRRLALGLAGDLPLNSGFVNLSLFGRGGDLMRSTLEELRFRYLGLNVHDGGLYMGLGHRINGVHWLNFLGQPVLGQLGGIEGLRARLPEPGIDIQELSGDRVLISLGERPQLGDVQAGETLPLYRALARVYEPYLYHEELLTWENKSLPRWERRFLD